MIHRKRLLDANDPQFSFAWELYEASFPIEERRSRDYHLESMTKGQFSAEVVFDDDNPIGILFWWDLTNFRFIEHLATSPTVRGKGYGDKILREFIAEGDKPIILEVEHPTEEINRRRIGFYERIGFVLNDHSYRHPSYLQIKDLFVDLMVMTYPNSITSNELQLFQDIEFPIIHFRSYC
ncbi:MAG: GNAT family N-acetyltransferase [Rikenellaceae bacterium]